MQSDCIGRSAHRALREQFRDHGQAHVFRFWSELRSAGRARLLSQAASIDLPALERIRSRALERLAGGAPGGLAPAPVERLPERGDADSRGEARERGEACLAAGSIAIVTVAGGEGSRLGFTGPKAAFPIGPVSGRTLLGLHAQKLRRLGRRFGRRFPWYVMTSPATDGPLRALLRAEDHFGLPAEDLVCFRQGTLPALDFDGRLLLVAPDRIAESPDGHGACLIALRDSGALAELRERGIDALFCFQVDNPLVRVAEPALLGLHFLRAAEMSCKVIARRDPGEQLGVPVRVGGRLAIIEYTEFPDAPRRARDARGRLEHWAGSYAVHVLSLPFAERVAARAEELLPHHASVKRIPCIGDAGRARARRAPNGHKFERFVFDALAAAARPLLVEGRREEEYAPVKNPDAEGGECPARARRALSDGYRRWLAAAGVAAPAEGLMEIDHEFADGPEDLVASGIARAGDAPGAIECTSEVHA